MDFRFSELDWIEQGLTSHQTHYRSYRGLDFPNNREFLHGRSQGGEVLGVLGPPRIQSH